MVAGACMPSPIASSTIPPPSAIHFSVVKVMNTREMMHSAKASRNVLRSPSASVRDPTSTIVSVSPADQMVTASPARTSLKPRSEESQSVSVKFTSR